MMERPWHSSSLAREKTARAPSPLSCPTRLAMRVMRESLAPPRPGWLGQGPARGNLFGRSRRDGNSQTFDEAREHFEGGSGEKEFDALEFRKRRGDLSEKLVVDRSPAFMQAIGEAEAQFFFFGVRAELKIRDAFDLRIRSAFLAGG